MFLYPILFLVCGALTLPAALAAPATPASPSCSNVGINIISGIIKALHGELFCSSFIHIPQVTSTVIVSTVTSFSTTTSITSMSTTGVLSISSGTNTVTSTTGTSTSTSTELDFATTTTVVPSLSLTNSIYYTTLPQELTTSISTITYTLTDYSYYPVPARKEKRDNNDDLEKRAAIPFPELAKYAVADISKACSCLNIPTSTVTILSTQTVKTLARTTVTSVTVQTIVVPSTTTVYDYIIASTTVPYTTTSTTVSPSTSVSISTIITTSTITPTISTVVSTMSVVSTTTVTYDPCDPTAGAIYSTEEYVFAGIFHAGYDTSLTTFSFGAINLVDCCKKCFNTPGCVVASALDGGEGCLVAVNGVQPTFGASTQCPTGLDFIDNFSGKQAGIPTEVLTNGDFVLGPCFAGGLSF